MSGTVLRDDEDACCTERGDHHLLQFTCPVDGCWIRIPITWGDPEPVSKRLGKAVWKATGGFPETLTLNPSVHVMGGPKSKDSHWHGWVKNGVAT